jgi:hypothetical protein
MLQLLIKIHLCFAHLQYTVNGDEINKWVLKQLWSRHHHQVSSKIPNSSLIIIFTLNTYLQQIRVFPIESSAMAKIASLVNLIGKQKQIVSKLTTIQLSIYNVYLIAMLAIALPYMQSAQAWQIGDGGLVRWDNNCDLHDPTYNTFYNIVA